MSTDAKRLWTRIKGRIEQVHEALTKPLPSRGEGLRHLFVRLTKNKRFLLGLLIIGLIIGFFVGSYWHSAASVSSIRIVCAAATPATSGFVLAMGIENPSLFSVDAHLFMTFTTDSVRFSSSERSFNIPAQRTVFEFFPFTTEQQYPGTLAILSTYHFLTAHLGDLQLSFKFQQNSVLDGITLPQNGCVP